jgi:phosphohistidine phosphatase
VKLVLMRHADAGNPDPARYPDDRLRPLSPQGEQEHPRLAAALARMGLVPTELLTSPLVRARQTADLTARALGWRGPIEVVDALGDVFSTRTVLERLGRTGDGAVVVCVGHEPTLAQFAATLLHPEGAVRITLPKSGVIGLDCPGQPAPGRARLLFLLPAQELLRLLG